MGKGSRIEGKTISIHGPGRDGKSTPEPRFEGQETVMIQRPPFHDPTSCRALQRDIPPPHPLTLLLLSSYTCSLPITTYDSEPK